MPTDIQINTDQSFASLVSYKSYIALLTQVGTSGPVATVLNSNDSNYLGNIVWVRNFAGSYSGNSPVPLPVDKTVVFITQSALGTLVSAVNNENDTPSTQVAVVTQEASTSVLIDDSLYLNCIEIRIYP